MGSPSIPVTIIGGGKVACGKHLKSASQQMSHMGAILAADRMHVHAIVETNDQKRSEIHKNWQFSETYDSLSNVPFVSNELITICTPRETHLKVALEAINRRHQALLIEKPCCASLSEAQQILRKSKRAGVKVFVNYNRRFDERIERVKNQFEGLPEEIHITYSKGIFNYASHLIDLAKSMR